MNTQDSTTVITPQQYADHARYSLHYALSYCGFGFLSVEIAKIEHNLITLSVKDDDGLVITVPISASQIVKGSVFQELALSVLSHRNSILEEKDRQHQMEILREHFTTIR